MNVRNPLLSAVLLLAGVGCADVTPAPEPVSAADFAAFFEAAFLEKDDTKADATGCSGVRVPDQGGFGKRVALTFDDGPDPVHTPKVLEALRAHEAPATFFVLGSATVGASRQALLRTLAIEPGVILGNHTWNHPNMARQSAETVARELDRSTAALQAVGVTPRYFRFPFGSSNCATAQAVRDRGMIITGWHIDSADWCYAAGRGRCRPETFAHVPDRHRDDMVGFILAQVAAREGGVLLFHDVHGYTADKLPEILSALVEAGYTFVGLDDVETFPRLNGEAPAPAPPPPPPVFVGSGCAEDADCAFVAGGARGLCHPAGLCVLPCAGPCPDRAGFAPTFCVADDFGAAPEGPGGVCVPQAHALNGRCADLPNTLDRTTARFVGQSGAAAREATVCLPVEAAE